MSFESWFSIVDVNKNTNYWEMRGFEEKLGPTKRKEWAVRNKDSLAEILRNKEEKQ